MLRGILSVVVVVIVVVVGVGRRRDDELLAVVGAIRRGGVRRSRDSSPAAVDAAVVGLTEQSVVPQSELVAGDQLSRARDAPETVDVVDLAARAHHEVVLTESLQTLGAFRAE